jgi:hypothetical protein
VIKLSKDHVDTETLWDRLGESGWQGRAYGLWASYFGAPKVTAEYKDNAFDPNTKTTLPTNARTVDSKYAPTKASAFNDIMELKATCRESAALMVFLHGDRDLTEDELDKVAVSVQQWRQLKQAPERQLLIDMSRRQVMEVEYGALVLNYAPYVQWEATQKISEQEKAHTAAVKKEVAAISEKVQGLAAMWPAV